MNMELVHKIGVEFSVQFLRYNEHSDTLFVVGLTALSIWPLRDGLFKSKQDSGVESPFPSDLWIADVHYIERTTSILIAVDTNLIIYGLKFHEITDRALNATARKITCVAFHPRYEYILVGSTDGVIKVFNVNLSLVHAFRVHTRSVTGLNIYPQGYLFLSSSLDKTFRLFDLKTMSEVYCNRIIDTSPLSIQMVNDQMFYVHMRDRIELWQARHLHHSLLMSSSPAEKITFVSNQKLGLSRIVVQTSDEIIRILSPVTGKPITMMLPFVQAKELKNLAYSIVSHKMYLLRTTGEIWIVDTKSNPCKLVDIWRQEESGKLTCTFWIYNNHSYLNSCPAFESMTSLCMFDGRLQSWNTPAGFNKDDGFAMLFGATDTGEVVLFNKSGYIEYRFQIHDGSIIQMSCLTKKQCIATLGTGKYFCARPVDVKLKKC